MRNFKNRKDEIVKEALVDSPLAAVLFFKGKGEGNGILLVSKGNRPSEPWFKVNVSEDLANASIGQRTPPGSDKTRVAAVILGIGNRSELTSVADLYRSIVYEEMVQLGLYPRLGQNSVEALAEYMNTEYRAADPAIPYRVELLVVNFILNELDIIRVQADGDFHSCRWFGVIGGYKEIKDGETVRRKAISFLRKLYATSQPNLAQARMAAKHLMELDGETHAYSHKAEYSFSPSTK